MFSYCRNNTFCIPMNNLYSSILNNSRYPFLASWNYSYNRNPLFYSFI